MTREEVFAKLKPLLADSLSVEPAEIEESKTLTELGADSLDAVSTIMDVEKFFHISFADAEAEKIQSVQELVNLIYSYTKDQA